MLQIDSFTTAGLIAISGPTGCGKTSIIDSLITLYPDRFMRVPSFTTRGRRSHEADREYTFVDQETILQMHARGELLNLDSVYGNLYGMSRQGIESILASGKLAIKEVHPRHHSALRESFPQLISILLQPMDAVDADTSRTWDAERRARLDEDAVYYEGIDQGSFEIVRVTSFHETPAAVAQHLFTTISALIGGRSRFPSPGEIDGVNAKGYSLAATEFVDERRITTAGFHQLSVSFFQDAINRFTGLGTSCLEIGPGSGWLRRCFTWPPLNYIGVELSSSMLEAHATPDQPHVQVASARAMPFPSAHFDVVFASLADPFSHPAAWCEIWRVMRPGGKFVFSAPAAEWATALRDAEKQDRTTFVLASGDTAEVFSFTFSEGQLRSELKLCGFDVIEFKAMTGEDLPPDYEVPQAFLTAANRAGIPHQALRILNCAIAQKPSAIP